MSPANEKFSMEDLAPCAGNQRDPLFGCDTAILRYLELQFKDLLSAHKNRPKLQLNARTAAQECRSWKCSSCVAIAAG